MLTRITDTGPDVFANAPLGLQIVTLPYQEEYCLAVSEVIDEVLNI
jgi:amidase